MKNIKHFSLDHNRKLPLNTEEVAHWLQKNDIAAVILVNDMSTEKIPPILLANYKSFLKLLQQESILQTSAINADYDLSYREEDLDNEPGNERSSKEQPNTIIKSLIVNSNLKVVDLIRIDDLIINLANELDVFLETFDQSEHINH